MLSLLDLATQLIPGLIKVVAGDKNGAVAQQLTDAIKQATKTENPEDAKKAVDTNDALKLELQQKLAEIALDELKEQHRAEEQQSQVDLAFYQDDLAEKDKERQADFDQYMFAIFRTGRQRDPWRWI